MKAGKTGKNYTFYAKHETLSLLEKIPDSEKSRFINEAVQAYVVKQNAG